MFEMLFGFDLFDQTEREKEQARFELCMEYDQARRIIDFQQDKEEQERGAIRMRAYIKGKKEK